MGELYLPLGGGQWHNPMVNEGVALMLAEPAAHLEQVSVRSLYSTRLDFTWVDRHGRDRQLLKTEFTPGVQNSLMAHGESMKSLDLGKTVATLQ